jgi:hypothetical protein
MFAECASVELQWRLNYEYMYAASLLFSTPYVCANQSMACSVKTSSLHFQKGNFRLEANKERSLFIELNYLMSASTFSHIGIVCLFFHSLAAV